MKASVVIAAGVILAGWLAWVLPFGESFDTAGKVLIPCGVAILCAPLYMARVQQKTDERIRRIGLD
jgi:hypothetical protein